ncbi:MAG: DNA-formamidopyrimidine glycosylase family protein [Mycobacteriales bacterium]
MPEGDTVWLTAKRLHGVLAGQRLTRGELRVPSLAPCDLRGRTVTGAAAAGKHLLIRFADAVTLHAHLRMDGSWVIVAAAARWPMPGHEVRAVLSTPAYDVLGRRVHDLAVVPTAEEASLVGHLGPDIMTEDFDLDAAAGRISATPDTGIGVALLDQRNVAGIGNLYQNETAFLSGVTPWTPVADVADPQQVVAIARRLMRANREHPEQSTTGDMRRGHMHWVYGRAGRPCRRCQTPIRTARLGPAPTERVAFWCPRCQGGPGPVDPARPRPSSF